MIGNLSHCVGLYENFFPTKSVILAPPTVHLDLIAAFLSTIHVQDFILLEKKKVTDRNRGKSCTLQERTIGFYIQESTSQYP